MLKSHIRQNGLVFRYFQSISSNQSSKFTNEVICSEENIDKCIKSMQSATQVKLTQKEYEKKAAVLIPICLHNNEISLLYTVRSAKMSQHVRQVSFPGGFRDSLNETWELCALRETEEEIGIPKEQINIWGIGGMITPPRPPSVMPVIGFVNEFDIRALKLNADEVERCFTVPLKNLCQNKGYTQFRTGFCAPAFTAGEKRIWGITGLMTHLFLTSLLPKDVYYHNMKYISKYRPK